MNEHDAALPVTASALLLPRIGARRGAGRLDADLRRRKQ